MNYLSNIALLARFLEGSLLWKGAGVFLAIAAIAAVVAAWLSFTRLKWREPFFIVAIGLFVAVLSWSSIVFKVHGPSMRYLLDGLAAFMAAVGITLLLIWQSQSQLRRYALVALAGLFVLYVGHAVARSADSFAAYSRIRSFGGLDPMLTRNRATMDAIKLARTGGYGGVILVDQYAYIDLRAFRSAGYIPEYINIANFSDVIEKLPRDKRILVLFSRGDYDLQKPDSAIWPGLWSESTKEAYDAYQARLLALPVVKHFDGPRQQILMANPVQPKIELFISALTPGR